MNLILGTANFGNNYGKRLEKDECFSILDRAKELGIKTVATAFDYGKDMADEYGWEDRIHKPRPGELEWNELSGKTLDKPDGKMHQLLMAPLNPMNLDFLPYVPYQTFIARSIFCGGKLQRSNKEDVARLILGFLKSHGVKNAVFGVESIEELELVVRVANEK